MSEQSILNPRRWRISFRLTVLGMFVVMTVLTATTAILLQYHFSTRLATDSARTQYSQAADRTREYLALVDQQTKSELKLLAAEFDNADFSLESIRARELFAIALSGHELFYSVYLGLPNGDLYELINLDNGINVRQKLMALPQDRWLLVTVKNVDGQRQRAFSYYDRDFNLRATRSESSVYDSRKRPWFAVAREGVVYKTEPYLFQTLQMPGQTFSIRLAGGRAVLGADITLSSLSAQLEQHRINNDSRLFLYQPNGLLIATSGAGQPALTLPQAVPLTLTASEKRIVAENPILTVSSLNDWPPFDYTVSGQPQGYSVDVLTLISQMTGLKFHFINGPSWPEFISQFHSGDLDILQSVLRTGDNDALGDTSKAYVAAPFGVLTLSGVAPIHDIDQLFGKRVAIPAGWSIIPTIRRHFPQVTIVEVNGVAGMFDAVRQGLVDAGIDTASQLEYTRREFFYKNVVVSAPLKFGTLKVPVGLHFSVQPKQQGVVNLINQAIDHITPEQRAVLNARWLGKASDDHHPRATVPYPELIDYSKKPELFKQLQQIDLEGKKQFLFIDTAGETQAQQEYFAVLTPVASVLANAHAEVTKVVLITVAILLLLLPIASWLASFIVTPVKKLAFENEKIRERRYGELVPVNSRIVEIDGLAKSLMGMAHSIEQHAKEQEALMDSFIKLIAQAIDEKSPYTGAHCARVPELALMLAHKASDSHDPPFDRFHFDTESEWREFRIGAWLHDCGKITTPEYIVDKGSKLETIYNRIHEIRTRFEVLWRDADIRYWEQRCTDPELEAQWRAERDLRHTELQEQFAFIAGCNEGGEFMDEANMARLDELAKITWQRHFDDRLGLSPIERQRLEAFAQDEQLPVTEPLLADKPWHREERTHNKTYPERYGIRMDVPELQYNRGEVYNLKIARGTLTPEDRFKINEHVISTIRMLDNLPLPDELKLVPRYASTHHETLDGRGYPRRLTAKDLSMPERIMVLADIFEALTAADRPYKKAKSLSEALEIMYHMVEEQHIDRDVFRLFLRSGTYLDYARAYLQPAQVDNVDTRRYLSSE